MKMFWLSFNQAKVSRFRNEERIFLDLFRYRLQPENKKEFFLRNLVIVIFYGQK